MFYTKKCLFSAAVSSKFCSSSRQRNFAQYKGEETNKEKNPKQNKCYKEYEQYDYQTFSKTNFIV